MKGCGGDQHPTPALRDLSGARYFFLVGKRVRTCRVAIDVLLAVGVIFLPTSSYWLAVASLVWLAVSRLGLSQWEERCRQRGAFAQWEFERTALRLSNVARLCGGPSGEDISTASKRMLDLIARRARRRIRVGIPAEAATDPIVVFRDWFPKDPVTKVQSLEAQRASAEYAKGMAQRWAAMCALVSVILLVSITLLAAFRGLTVSMFLVSLLLPCLPIMVALGEELISNLGANEMRKLVIFSGSLSSSLSAEGIEAALASNAILALLWRTRAHGIPDFIYWIMRTGAETRMRSNANG